jgi:putative FmdB family regulatory protein
MPIYEYRCLDCGRRVSIFWRSLSAVNEKSAVCDRCGSRRLTRLASRVRVLRGNGSGDAGSSGDDVDDALLNEMADLDENDPRALGRFMRKMAQESGEDLGPEFEEVVGRLEKGEDPEQIEKSMGDLFGDEMAGPAGAGMDDDYGAPPEDKADKEAEAKDRKATEKRRTVPMSAKGKSRSRTKARKPARKKA